MVALAIFATAAMTLTKVAMQYTQSTSNAILRTKAQFVALNEVAQMEINQQWMDGTASRQLTQQGETWQIDKRSEPPMCSVLNYRSVWSIRRLVKLHPGSAA